MEFIKKSIPEIILIKPKIFEDERGYFVESFRNNEFEKAVGKKINFCQDNESRSRRGVLRGLHFQLPPFAQSKLVRVIEGEVLDVAVDIRYGSPTFGKHVAVHLSGKNKYQMFIPRGFAHGFVVLSEEAVFYYKVDNYYSAENEIGLAFNDPALGINWQLPISQLILSDKDSKNPVLEKLKDETLKLSYNHKHYD